MNKNIKTSNARRWCSFVGALAIICAASLVALAQTTSGGTVITNTATSTYTDGAETFTTISNTITVTVSNVAGLTITPDAATNPSVVPGQTLVNFVFTVNNTGNFTNQVLFGNAGASIIKTGTAASTVTKAVIDLDNSGTVTGGDIDILTNSGVVTSANLLRDTNLKVVVEVSVDPTAAPTQTINIQLGDAAVGSPWDNEALVVSAGDVVTGTTGVNGQREARGDISVTVETDALIRLSLTRTAGPVAVGSDITYTWILTNDGARAASAQTLTVNAAPVTGIFIIAPIPARTTLQAGQIASFPAGTIYTTTAITTAPLAATWTSTAPATLAERQAVTRVGFNTGNALAALAATTPITLLVTVNTGISIVLPIRELGDAFSKNSLTTLSITDQSHDGDSNSGDGNADFTESDSDGDGDGHMLDTLLSSAGGSVLLGPAGFPGAFGSGTDTNNDYTNRSVSTGILVEPGTNTNASGIVTFTNTIRNTGDADDTYRFSPSAGAVTPIPSGFTVEVSVNGLGTDYVNLTTLPTLAVAYNTSKDILVRVTEPAGNMVLTGYPTQVRATSLNTTSANNDTIDRLYTGYLSLVKSHLVSNATGVGAGTDPVPGATIAYTITYDNVSLEDGGTNSRILSAGNVEIVDPVPGNTIFAFNSALSTGVAGTFSYSSFTTGTDWTYVPVDTGGYDTNVKRVRFVLAASMAPAAAVSTIKFTVRIP